MSLAHVLLISVFHRKSQPWEIFERQQKVLEFRGCHIQSWGVLLSFLGRIIYLTVTHGLVNGSWTWTTWLQQLRSLQPFASSRGMGRHSLPVSEKPRNHQPQHFRIDQRSVDRLITGKKKTCQGQQTRDLE